MVWENLDWFTLFLTQRKLLQKDLFFQRSCLELQRASFEHQARCFAYCSLRSLKDRLEGQTRIYLPELIIVYCSFLHNKSGTVSLTHLSCFHRR